LEEFEAKEVWEQWKSDASRTIGAIGACVNDFSEKRIMFSELKKKRVNAWLKHAEKSRLDVCGKQVKEIEVSIQTCSQFSRNDRPNHLNPIQFHIHRVHET